MFCLVVMSCPVYFTLLVVVTQAPPVISYIPEQKFEFFPPPGHLISLSRRKHGCRRL